MSVKRKSHELENTSSSKKKKTMCSFSSVENYLDSLTFKARVTSVRDISTTNAGKCLSFDLIDNDRESRCIVFEPYVDEVSKIIKPGKIYYFSNFAIGKKNEMYSKLNCTFELHYKKGSIIEKAPDDETCNIPKFNFNFLLSSEIKNKKKDEVVDTCVYVMEVKDVEVINSNKGNTFIKRQIIVCDATDDEMEICLWNNRATNCGFKINDILAIKSAKVGVYGGSIYLSAVASTTVYVNNFDIKEISHYILLVFTTKSMMDIDDVERGLKNSNSKTQPKSKICSVHYQNENPRRKKIVYDLEEYYQSSVSIPHVKDNQGRYQLTKQYQHQIKAKSFHMNDNQNKNKMYNSSANAHRNDFHQYKNKNKNLKRKSSYLTFRGNNSKFQHRSSKHAYHQKDESKYGNSIKKPTYQREG